MPGEPIPIVIDDPAVLRLADAALSVGVYGVAMCTGAAARVTARDRGQQLRACLPPSASECRMQATEAGKE